MSRLLLYIDPDPATRRLVHKVLAPAGFTVLDAENARDGSRLAQRSRPELVLVDVDGADTTDLVRTLRELPGLEQSILLASTSDHRPESVTRMVRSGFRGVLLKPLDVDNLAQELLRRAGEDMAARAGAVARPPRSHSATPIHPLWRQALAPILASAVQSAATAYGLLALHDEADDTLVLAATHSLRPADDMPQVGTRVPSSVVEWLLPALRARQTVLPQRETLDGAALVAATSTIVLAVPVASQERIYGAAIFGERRQRPFGLPEAQVTQCAAEAKRIGSILHEFERRDEAIRRRRQEIDHARLAAAHSIATGLPFDLKREDPDQAGRVRLGLALADRLGLPAVEKTILKHALETHDLGRRWLQRMVTPLVNLPATDAQAILDTEALETCTFVQGLGWPEPVVELLDTGRTALHTAEAPLAAQILSVVMTYHELLKTSGTGKDPARVLIELRRTSGRHVDAVLTALHGLVEDEQRSA